MNSATWSTLGFLVQSATAAGSSEAFRLAGREKKDRKGQREPTPPQKGKQGWKEELNELEAGVSVFISTSLVSSSEESSEEESSEDS